METGGGDELGDLILNIGPIEFDDIVVCKLSRK